MTCNKKNRWVFHLAPTARDYAKLEVYFTKMKYWEFEVSAARADFGDISGVKEVSVSRQGWGKNRTDVIEYSIYRLKDMFSGYRKKEVNMFPNDVNTGNGKITNVLEEIEKLNYNEEGRLELEKNIGELGNRIGISGENPEKKPKEQRKEPESQENRRDPEWLHRANDCMGPNREII